MPTDTDKSKLTRRLPILIFLAVVFFRPIVSGMGVEVYSPRVFTDMLLGVIPLLLVLYAGLSKRIQPAVPAGWGILLLFIAAMVAGLAGLNRFQSAERIFALAGGMGLAICAATWGRDEKERDELIGAMLIAAALVAIYGIYQYFWGFSRTIEYISQEGAGPLDSGHARKVLEGRRIFSTTFSPDMLAGFLAMMLPISLGAMRDARSIGGKAARGMLILLLVVSLYMTGSLGGWLAAGAGMTAWYLALVTEPKKRIFAAGVIGVVVLILAAGIVFRRSETILNFSHAENPIVQRLYFWEGGLKVALHHPLLGVGPGNFGTAYLGQMRQGAEMTRYAHSHWINILAETGPVGLAGWVLIMVAFIVGSWRNTLNPPHSALKGTEAGIFAGGVAFLAHGMIDFDLAAPEVAGYFWVLVGLSAAGVKVFGTTESRYARIGMTVSAALFASLGILLMPGDSYMQDGRMALKDGKSTVAVWSFTKAAMWRPWDPMVFVDRAGAWPPDTVEGRELAYRDYKRALALCPADPFIWMKTGEFFFRVRDFQDALTAFKNAEERVPTWPVAVGWRRLAAAKVYVINRQYNEARHELWQVLQVFPGHPGALQGIEELDELEKSLK